MERATYARVAISLIQVLCVQTSLSHRCRPSRCPSSKHSALAKSWESVRFSGEAFWYVLSYSFIGRSHSYICTYIAECTVIDACVYLKSLLLVSRARWAFHISLHKNVVGILTAIASVGCEENRARLTRECRWERNTKLLFSVKPSIAWYGRLPVVTLLTYNLKLGALRRYLFAIKTRSYSNFVSRTV